MSTLQDGVVVIERSVGSYSPSTALGQVTPDDMAIMSLVFWEGGKEQVKNFDSSWVVSLQLPLGFRLFEEWVKRQGAIAVLDIPFGFDRASYSTKLFEHAIRLVSGEKPLVLEVLLRQDVEPQIVTVRDLKNARSWAMALQEDPQNQLIKLLGDVTLSRHFTLALLAYQRGALTLEELANPVFVLEARSVALGDNLETRRQTAPSEYGVNSKTLQVNPVERTIALTVPNRFWMHWFGEGAGAIGVAMNKIYHAVGVTFTVQKGS